MARNQRKEAIMKYIVILEKNEKGCGPIYRATWPGDPGRTFIKQNAKRFNTLLGAEKAIRFARGYRPFINAEIEAVEE